MSNIVSPEDPGRHRPSATMPAPASGVVESSCGAASHRHLDINARPPTGRGVSPGRRRERWSRTWVGAAGRQLNLSEAWEGRFLLGLAVSVTTRLSRCGGVATSGRWRPCAPTWLRWSLGRRVRHGLSGNRGSTVPEAASVPPPSRAPGCHRQGRRQPHRPDPDVGAPGSGVPRRLPASDRTPRRPGRASKPGLLRPDRSSRSPFLSTCVIRTYWR
jgi:hypothetical protein